MLEDKPGVVLLTASNYSAYAISVLELLTSRGIAINGVVIRKLADRSRILREFKESGFPIIAKVLKKLVLQRLGMGKAFQDGFSAYYRDNGYKHVTVTDFCDCNGVNRIVTSDFHTPETLAFVTNSSPSLIVFTGGGLVRQAMIDRAGTGVMNCHMGVLPDYRGMDCTYWCVLNEDSGNIGFTVHFMDSGVDTGPIIEVHRIDATEFATVDEVVHEIEYRMAPAITAAVDRVLRGAVNSRTQAIEEGRQYFTIAPECLALARRRFVSKGI